jgi:hypothetical protein
MEIIVEKDKKVTVMAIYQWATYGELLEGLPNPRLNEQIIARARQRSSQLSGGYTAYLIEPTQTPIAYEGNYPFGTPARLPAIICIAELKYFGAVRNPSMDYSTLGVLWFQDQYAFPIAADVLKAMESIPWSELAAELEYG